MELNDIDWCCLELEAKALANSEAKQLEDALARDGLERNQCKEADHTRS